MKSTRAQSEVVTVPEREVFLTAIRDIKTTALTFKDGKAALGRIVRLCIDAEKATGTYLTVDKRNLTIKRLTSKHNCDSEIRRSAFAMSGYRTNKDRWQCSCGQVYAFLEDEAEGGGWWPQAADGAAQRDGGRRSATVPTAGKNASGGSPS